MRKKRLGEMLVEASLMTDEQVDQVVVEHKKTGMKMGQYIVRNGIVSESQIMNTISQQLKVEKYDPKNYPLDTQLSRVISSEAAQKYQVAPLRKKGPLLTIAMPDPMDLGALDAIEMMTNSEVEPVICTEQDLSALINAIYGQYSGFDGVIEDVEEMEIAREEIEKPSGIDEVEVSSIQDMAAEAPVIRLVNSILSQAIRENSSDVHISPERDRINIRFRVDGKLHDVPAPQKSMFLPIISRFKILGNMDIAVSRIPQDGRFSIRMGNREINVRASVTPTIYGENLVLRLLDTSTGVYSLENLGMSEQDIARIEPMLTKPYGMILSTGPTGSGKSTSLFSLLNLLNHSDINIITLEDPVEYRMNGVRQIQLNTKAGMTFANGLRSVLRQDPDIIMVGEIRDTETATISVQAALTGHRVLSTVHTNDAIGAITRLIDMGIEPFLVASVMLLSVAQRLVRRICPQCQEEYDPPAAARDFFGFDPDEDITFVRGKGCFHCMESGYKGRIGLYEILTISEELQEMIVQRSSSREMSNVATASGNMRTLKYDAADKIRKGLTTIEEAASAVMG